MLQLWGPMPDPNPVGDALQKMRSAKGSDQFFLESMSRGVVAVCDGDIWETRDSWIAGCNG